MSRGEREVRKGGQVVGWRGGGTLRSQYGVGEGEGEGGGEGGILEGGMCGGFFFGVVERVGYLEKV